MSPVAQLEHALLPAMRAAEAGDGGAAPAARDPMAGVGLPQRAQDSARASGRG